MTATVYMTGREPLQFDTAALAEAGLRAMGFVPRTGQPRQWVALRDDGNLFASLVEVPADCPVDRGRTAVL